MQAPPLPASILEPTLPTVQYLIPAGWPLWRLWLFRVHRPVSPPVVPSPLLELLLSLSPLQHQVLLHRRRQLVAAHPEHAGRSKDRRQRVDTIHVRSQ